MKRLVCQRRMFAILLVLSLLGSCIGAVGENSDSNSLFCSLAMDAKASLEQICFDAQPEAAMLHNALEAALSHPECIRQSTGDGLYDFPALEVEQSPLTWRAALLQDSPQEHWLISFFPEKVPQTAACVVIDEQRTITAVFPNTTWAMQKLWEEALSLSSTFWPVETRYLFHMLFEPKEMWHAAALPTDSTISQEASVQLANQALADKYFSGDPEALSVCHVVAQYSLTKQYDPKGMEIWSVHYYQEAHQDAVLLWSVDLDASNGTILDVRMNDPSHG